MKKRAPMWFRGEECISLKKKENINAGHGPRKGGYKRTNKRVAPARGNTGHGKRGGLCKVQNPLAPKPSPATERTPVASKTKKKKETLATNPESAARPAPAFRGISKDRHCAKKPPTEGRGKLPHGNFIFARDATRRCQKA